MGEGICIWFTGLSGSGKTTTADKLKERLERGGRSVTMLDGDECREHLSKGLGFSREDRDTNILRLAFVAREIVRHGGIVICAAISPYAKTRKLARLMVGPSFLEVYVNTPLQTCEARDPKGLYKLARQGVITQFTGLDDPYEVPAKPDIVLDTVKRGVRANTTRLIKRITLALTTHRYYVYFLIDPFSAQPFYVGKGTGDRSLQHLKETEENTENKFKLRKIKNIRDRGGEPQIVRIADDLDEFTAYELEEQLIATLGRRNDGKGLLTNICDSVRPPGSRRPMSDEEKQKLSESRKGAGNPCFGRKWTEKERAPNIYARGY